MTSPEKRPSTNQEQFDEEISPDIADFSLNKDSAEGPAETKKPRKRKSRLKDPLLSEKDSNAIKNALSDLTAHYEGIPVKPDELTEDEKKENSNVAEKNISNNREAKKKVKYDQLSQEDLINYRPGDGITNSLERLDEIQKRLAIENEKEVLAGHYEQKASSATESAKSDLPAESKEPATNSLTIENKDAQNPANSTQENSKNVGSIDKKQGQQESKEAESREVLSLSEIKFCQDITKLCIELNQDNKKRLDILKRLPYILQSGNGNLNKQEIKDFVSYSLYNIKDSIEENRGEIKFKEDRATRFKEIIKDMTGADYEFDDIFEKCKNIISGLFDKLDGRDRFKIENSNAEYQDKIQEALKSGFAQELRQTESLRDIKRMKNLANEFGIIDEKDKFDAVSLAFKDRTDKTKFEYMKEKKQKPEYKARDWGADMGLFGFVGVFIQGLEELPKFMARAVTDLMSNKFPQDVLNMIRNTGEKINYWLNPEQDPANKSKDKDK